MAAKSANLYARIEPDVKEQAESILATLGIPTSSAINMFFKQIILQNGIPFHVVIPSKSPIDIAELSISELDVELERGYMDLLNRRTKGANEVFASIHKDYEI